VVTKIDRLARSLAHLLDIVERLTAIGAAFKSLSDPIDTTGHLDAWSCRCSAQSQSSNAP
jgi:DNA invertase Pin-like site-specific DNA recombinase